MDEFVWVSRYMDDKFGEVILHKNNVEEWTFLPLKVFFFGLLMTNNTLEPEEEVCLMISEYNKLTTVIIRVQKSSNSVAL